MDDYINLPFFSTENGKVKYLKQHQIIDTAGLLSRPDLATELLVNRGVIIRRSHKPKSKKEGGGTLVLEPHPDDFALSAAGYAIKAINDGDSISVLNIFSETALSNFAWKGKVKITKKQLEELRLLESRIAVEDYLDQKFETLRLPTSTIRGNKEIFATKQNEPDLVADLCDELIGKMKEGTTRVLCPMGIQGHLDHLVVFDAAMQSYRSSKVPFEVIFYPEYPYARNRAAYDSRLSEINKMCTLEPFYVDVGEYLEQMSDLVSIYRSQFDDIDRHQMLAVIKEDCRAVGAEAASKNIIGSSEFMQKYYRLKELT